MSQRCTSSHTGREARKIAIDPAVTAMRAFTVTLITICVKAGASDWTSTVPTAERKIAATARDRHRNLRVKQVGHNPERKSFHRAVGRQALDAIRRTARPDGLPREP